MPLPMLFLLTVMMVGLLFSPRSVVAAGDLRDLNENCPGWANSGECQKNPDYMLYNCAKSCHQDVPDSFYDIKAEDIDGKMIDFEMFRGRVVYIVNVASECGFTVANYQLLRQLSEFRKKTNGGFEMLIFPCNQFGRQEPGESDQIKNFARGNGYDGIIMKKGGVEGFETQETFRYLKQKTGKTSIGWNFDGKFVVDHKGKPHAIGDKDPVQFIEKVLSGQIYNDL